MTEFEAWMFATGVVTNLLLAGMALWFLFVEAVDRWQRWNESRWRHVDPHALDRTELITNSDT